MKLTQKTCIFRICTRCQSRDTNSSWWHLEHECVKYLLRLEETKNGPRREHSHHLAMQWRRKSQEAGPTPHLVSLQLTVDPVTPMPSKTVTGQYQVQVLWPSALYWPWGPAQGLCPLSTCYHWAIHSTHKSLTFIDKETSDLVNQ